MNELGLRAFFFSIACFLIGAIAALALRGKLSPERASKFWKKYWVYLLVINTLGAVFVVGTPLVILVTCGALVLISSYEVLKLLPRLELGVKSIAIVCFLLVSVAFLLFLQHFRREFVFFVFATVCLFDAFSQVFGQSLGRHKLTPTLSPGKSIEGAAAGFVFAQIAASTFPLPEWGAVEASAMAFAISIAALAGDLSASLFKRLAQVKDFSDLIPGHGGILDRFDSFFMAGALCWLIAAVVGYS